MNHKNIASVLILSLGFIQCALLQPSVKPVKAIYLGNETELEKKKTEQLENQAIEIRDLVKVVEKEQEFLKQKKTVNSKKTELVKKNLEYLDELNKLTLMKNNDPTSTAINDKISSQHTSLDGEMMYGRMIEAQIRAGASKLKLKRSELAKVLAELELTKAEIAARNQAKIQMKPEDKDIIKLDEYRHFFNYQNEEYAKNKSQFELDENEVKTIKQQMNSISYTPEY